MHASAPRVFEMTKIGVWSDVNKDSGGGGGMGVWHLTLK